MSLAEVVTWTASLEAISNDQRESRKHELGGMPILCVMDL